MKNIIKIISLIGISILLYSCNSNKVNFITTEEGKKQYKNEDGIFVKDDWVEVNGGKYYFDKNGYLVTNSWVQNDYYVGDDGKMQTEYWYNNGKDQNYYYLGKDGKYVKNNIIEIGNKKYAFDKDGLWIKNRIFVSPIDKSKILLSDKNGNVAISEGEYEVIDGKYYIDRNGNIITNEWKNIDGKKAYYDFFGKRVFKGFAVLEEDTKSTSSDAKRWLFLDENGDIVKDQYIDYKGENYCAEENGILLANGWKEYNGKKYFYGPDCNLLKNQIVDNVYYVDDTGAMVTNKEININGKMYVFGSDGRGNVKVIKKTSNNYWIIRNYTNTGEKYVTNINYFHVSGFDRFQLIVDKDDCRMRIYWENSKTLIKKTEDNVFISISINQVNNYLIDNETIKWDKDGYIVFNDSQKKKIIDALCHDANELILTIHEYGASHEYRYGTVINAIGFNEIYSSL